MIQETFLHHLQTRARQLGFDLVGTAPARPPANHVQAYEEWLARGDHGEMAYMGRPDRVARRRDSSLILPGARSAICVAANYYPGPLPLDGDEGKARRTPIGRISNYAWGGDYHDWMLPRLEELAVFVQSEIKTRTHHRAYVDTGPVLERALAAQAGLGFVGKNTCLIHPQWGSCLFLGVLLVDVDLPFTENPIPPRCGTCTRCLESCPTGALAAPYRLDARRCISYLAIELKGPVPPDLRPQMGNWIYGCDICQEVCPWQRFAQPTIIPVFQAASADRSAPSLIPLMALSEEGFRHRFQGSPILRIGRERLLRNVTVALGNLGDPEAVPALQAALIDESPLVRGHAAWALGRIGGAAAVRALEIVRQQEIDPYVREEVTMALQEVNR